MALGSPKSVAAYPRSLQSIAASVGGLALFLIFASLILVSHPIGSTLSGYLYSIDRSSKVGSLSFINETSIAGLGVSDIRMPNSPLSGGDDSLIKDDQQRDFLSRNKASQDKSKIVSSQEVDGSSSSPQDVVETSKKEVQQPVLILESSQERKNTNSSQEDSTNPLNVSEPNEEVYQPGSAKESQNSSFSDSSKGVGTEASQTVNSGCDLYDGHWVYDSAGPLYSNNSCPVLSQMQNCQGNGRPDKDYENWRWKPTQCDLPRFDPRKFLELMRGKTLAYIGDSVARNQMESMLCILWQVEEPKNRGYKKMQRYYFRSTSTMIIRIWSSWLVHRTTEKFDFAPEGIDKLHLDAPDETFMDFLPTFDVLVLSSGHWFAKQSVYILNNEIVGGQLWWPDKSRAKKIDSTKAFEISVETIISSLVTHPNYTGLTVIRSYSPDHYEGGSWNTGGSCTGKVKPAVDGELVESGFTNTMHEKQVLGFKRAVNKRTNKSRVKLMDITKPFSYRHDGHPGPYRSLDPNKVTKRGPDGRPPPQDCLHWCMPGPVDTWNELLLEVIRRDFEGADRESYRS